MPPRGTTDALIRLRRADQQEAIGELRRARDAAERADRQCEAARAAQASLLQRLQRLAAARPARMTAAALARRDCHRAQLRSHLEDARRRVDAADRELRTAHAALDEAQRRVEQALRAREAAEAQRASELKAHARRRERRDQAALDERWRPPRR